MEGFWATVALKDSHISQNIEIDIKGHVYKQCRAMLNAWTRNQPGSFATCEQLVKALSPEIVMTSTWCQFFVMCGVVINWLKIALIKLPYLRYTFKCDK